MANRNVLGSAVIVGMIDEFSPITTGLVAFQLSRVSLCVVIWCNLLLLLLNFDTFIIIWQPLTFLFIRPILLSSTANEFIPSGSFFYWASIYSSFIVRSRRILKFRTKKLVRLVVRQASSRHFVN